MLSDKMVEALNRQVDLECYSSHLYLQMSSWCDYKGYTGAAKFLYQHAQEERMHMQKLFDYINETGAMACVGQINAPCRDFTNITNIFEKTLAHEQQITKAINNLVAQSVEEKDYSTFHFLQWYVAEQHEEEKTFRSILDKLSLVEGTPSGIFLVDRELGQMAAS